MNTLRTLVTGGAGFIGSNLCRRLLADGHHVIALDNLFTGSLANIRDLHQEPRFRFVHHDVCDRFDIAADRMYHLACPASPPHYQRDPIRTTLTIVEGTYHALLNAEKHRARFLLASTSQVYGDPECSPQHEDYRGNVSCVGPRACYDEGKRCAESLVMDFNRRRGADIRIARIFNTYGPSMALDDGRVVSNFITQTLRGDSMTVYGDGQQTRSLCYVDDLVDGLVRLMDHDDVTGPVNLGNPLEMTVLEIAEAVRRHLGRGRIVRRPLPPDDPRRRCPDITRARTVLGFDPKVTLDEGLPKTIRYFERKIAEEGPRLSFSENTTRPH